MPQSTEETLESIAASSSESKTMAALVVEKEKLHENKYRNMYRALLKKHEGILTENKATTNLEEYQEETTLLRTVIISERNAWIMGVTVGLAAFVTIRFLPRVYIRRFGGAEKLNKLKEAEELSRQNKTAWAQGAIGTLIECSLSFWIGVRAYQLASQASDSTFEVIAQIPLAKGRSVVADKLCPEWVRITKLDIPPAFWDNLDEANNLKDERTWNAIRSFSHNCIKRKLYERVVAKDQEGDVSLPNRVPDFVPAALQLTTEQALQLVSDR